MTSFREDLLKQVAITEADSRSCTNIDNDSLDVELLLHLLDLRLGFSGHYMKYWNITCNMSE